MRIQHVSLSVSSLESSCKFYIEKFGFAEFKSFERQDLEAKAKILKLEDTLLELWEFHNQILNKDDFSNLNILGIKHFAIEVEDVDLEYQRLKSLGVEISEPKIGAIARYCFVKDPDGFPIEILKFL